VCAVHDLPCGTGRYVELGNRALAVFRVGDEVRVIDDACPHAGAPLSAGHVDDGCVVCSLHGWAFRLRDGRCPDNEGIGVRVYESRVVDGVVQARLT
jgi:NAD(P)H-dependent nitrite reductase small subunit